MKVWTKPSVAAYRDVLLEQNISIRRSLTWVGGAWLVRSLVGILLTAILYVTVYRDTIQRLEAMGLDFDYEWQLITNLVCLPLGLIIGLGLYVIFGVGVPHIVARGAFGGKGRFEPLLFLYSSVTTPPILVTTVIGVLPLGFLASLILLGLLLLVSLYVILLYTIAVRSVHSIGWLASLVSVLALPIGFLLFFCCCSLFSQISGG